MILLNSRTNRSSLPLILTSAFAGLMALAAACHREFGGDSAPDGLRAHHNSTPAPSMNNSRDVPASRPAVVAGEPPNNVTFIHRDDPRSLRLLCYNVKWNSIFPDVSAERAAKFRRLIGAIRPDVIALQEIGTHPNERDRASNPSRNADHVSALLNEIVPLPGGRGWHAFQGSDNVIACKYPLSLTARKLNPPGDRELAMALIDLPDDDFPADLYLLNNHYKCCDPAQFDGRRQRQSDAIVAWLRDATSSGGNLDLARGTGFIVAGDLNIVGSFQPVTTLLTGDIVDETTYGPDAQPDWDASALADAQPRHNQTGPGDWTWRDDNSQFAPGRLDFVIYSDSVLEVVESFALDTTTMTDADLQAAGLEKFDVTHDNVGREYDHLPLVVDFRARR